jgi:hypothetical protein
MSDESKTHASEQLLEAIIQTGGMLSQIVNHMAEWSGAQPGDLLTTPEPLPGLLGRILAPALEARPAGELATAAALLRDVNRVVADEVILVPPPRPRRKRRRR